MASTINASTGPVPGLISTGDNSGQIELQANGATKLTVSSSGVTIPTLVGANINLATNVTGTLPIANGGTGTTSTTFVNLATNVTGTLPVANGGIGATSLSGAGIPTTSSSNNFTATQTFTGSSSVAGAKIFDVLEGATISATAATGTINYDVTTQAVLYYTSAAQGNWSVNFRGSSGTTLNSLMSTGESITVAFLVTQGSPAYYNTSPAVYVDSSSVGPKWQGGTAPTSGNTNSVDVYVYTIIKRGNDNWDVFASQTKFA